MADGLRSHARPPVLGFPAEPPGQRGSVSQVSKKLFVPGDAQSVGFVNGPTPSPGIPVAMST